MSNAKYIAIVIVVGIVLIAAAVMVGKSDSGAINVNETINNSNQANLDAGNGAGGNVGTTPAALRNLPNGGLVPQGSKETPKAPEPEPIIEEEVASTTNESGNTEDVSTEPASVEAQTEPDQAI